MMLAASLGTGIRIEAEGEDAQAAIDALEELVNNRFGEPE
jgi:phosphocarrier protein